MANLLFSLLDRWSRRYAVEVAVPSTRPATVITGASEGIGRALARRFAGQGHTVVLVARRRAMLEEVATAITEGKGGEAIVLALDVNEPSAPAAIEQALGEHGLHAEILINNAGFGLSGDFIDIPAADIEALVSCNVAALTRLSRHFLPAMRARASGGIVNIASLAGLAPGPYQAAYYASKAYVISLSRALAWENRGTGVRVMVVTPGPVETAFHARMNAETSFYRYLVPSPTAELVAAATWRGWRWRRRMVAPGISAKLTSLMLRLVPKFLVIPAIAWLLFPRGGETTTDVRGEKH